MRIRRHYRAAVSAECRFIYGFSVNPSNTTTAGSTECRCEAAFNVRRWLALTEMKDLVAQLSRLAGHPPSLGAFEPTPLFAGAHYDLAPAAAEYFLSCIPAAQLDLSLYRILSAANIDAENRDYVPSCFCAPHGFITIGCELSGDAFSIDVRDGRVFHLSHEKYETDGIHPGWNADRTALLPTLPVTQQNIIDTSEGYWESITDFLEECLQYATANA